MMKDVATPLNYSPHFLRAVIVSGTLWCESAQQHMRWNHLWRMKSVRLREKHLRNRCGARLMEVCPATSEAEVQ